MIKVFACFLLGCVVLTFGARRERIGYGTKVTESELKEKFPFMVYVKVCDSASFGGDCNHCTGTLMKPDRVIVAAHCYCGKGDYPTTTVYSSSLKIGSRKGKATAAGRITSGMPTTHCGKLLRSNVGRDIALIRLIQKLDVPTVPLFCKRNGWWTVVFLIDGKTKVVKFPHRAVPLGTKVWMVGYGYDEKKVPGTLRVATTRTAKCPEHISQNSFCVKVRHKTPTMLGGDSGGPLLIKRGGRFIQIGVISAGGDLIKRPGWYSWNFFANVRPLCEAN